MPSKRKEPDPGARQHTAAGGRSFSDAFSSTYSTTPDTTSAAAQVRVTHPYHPLLGQQFVVVAQRSSRHGDRVWYERADGSVATIPREWTDMADSEPFVELAEGRCHFRPADLAELAEHIVRIQGGQQASEGAGDV